MENKKKSVRQFSGVVVSDKMDKTIVVKVSQTKHHPKYLKIYRTQKKYKVDDPKEQYHIGDLVDFIQCRPLSKDKCWRVIYK